MCGCGQKTKIVTKTNRRYGHVMGQPFRFIHGHSGATEGKGPNRFKLRRGLAVIFLERQDGTVLECLVSRKDFDRVRRHHWYANRNGKGASYAAAWIDGASVHMHKYLCLIGSRLTTKTATAWTIGVRIFVELEEPTEPWGEWLSTRPAKAAFLSLRCRIFKQPFMQS